MGPREKPTPNAWVTGHPRGRPRPRPPEPSAKRSRTQQALSRSCWGAVLEDGEPRHFLTNLLPPLAEGCPRGISAAGASVEGRTRLLESALVMLCGGRLGGAREGYSRRTKPAERGGERGGGGLGGAVKLSQSCVYIYIFSYDYLFN